MSSLQEVINEICTAITKIHDHVVDTDTQSTRLFTSIEKAMKTLDKNSITLRAENKMLNDRIISLEFDMKYLREQHEKHFHSHVELSGRTTYPKNY